MPPVERARVVVVREQLEDREVANYVPLADRFDVRLVTTVEAGPYAATGLGLPLTRLRTRAQRVRPALARRGVTRVLRERLDLDVVPDLARALAGAAAVVVNETHLATSAALAAARPRGGPPVVVVCYENIPFRYEESVRLRDRKRTVRAYADRFVALTPEARDALTTEGVSPERVDLVTYGVDARRFGVADAARRDRRRRSWGAADDDVVVLYTGRLLQEKGLIPLLLAGARLPAGSRWRLVLVGSGPERTRVEAAAATLGVASRVVVQPWVPPAEIPDVLAAADLFTLPSLPTPYWEEQLGFSLVEAMAAGLPALVVASGSIPYVLGGGGLSAPPYDVAALADALARLVADAGLRAELGAAGRERVASVLSTDVAAAGLAATLERVLRR